MKLDNLWRCIGFTRRTYYLALAGMALSSAAVELVIPIMLQIMLDIATRGDASGLLWNSIFCVSAFLLSLFVSLALRVLFQARAAEISGGLRQAVYAKLHRLPMSYFSQAHSGAVLSLLSNDIPAAEAAYTSIPMSVTGGVVEGVAGIIYLIYLDYRLALYAVGLGLTSLLLNARLAQPFRQLSAQVQERLSGLTELFSDLLAGFVTIRSYGLEGPISQRFALTNEQTYHQSMQLVRRQSLVLSSQELLVFLHMIGLIGLGSFLVSRGSLTVGAVFGAFGMIGPTARLFNSLATALPALQTAMAPADRIFAFLDSAEIEQPAEPTVQMVRAGALELRNVSFSYPGSESPTLDGISLTVCPGQTVAVVGPSGSGKSSLLKLILGFYQPSSGDVRVGGAPAGSSAAMAQLSYVPQNAYLFSGTIGENIAYGRPAATQDEIIAAAQAAHADEFVAALPAGFSTDTGDQGLQLSGGQRQRIALARAFLREAPVMLLDEATSALDSESERLVGDAIARLRQGRTTLMVTHRLSSLGEADRIIVLEAGRIVEEGTHQELLQRRGLYFQLYEQQLRGEPAVG